MMTLKNVLFVNGASSGLTGLILITCAKFISDLFEVPSPIIFIGTGVFLIAFALLVIVEAFRGSNSIRNVQLIVTLDVVWVVMSVVVLIMDASRISTFGNILIAGVAIWVLLMVILQRRGLKSLTVK